jgi:hypothetical protein
MSGETERGPEAIPTPTPPASTGGRLAVVEDLTRKNLSDARILIGLVVGCLVMLSSAAGGGWAAYAQVRSAAVEDNAPIVKRLEVVEAKQAATDSTLVESNKRSAAVERRLVVIDLNTKLLLKNRGIDPVTLPDEASP